MKHRNKWAKLLFRFERVSAYINQGKTAFFKDFGISSVQYEVLKVLYISETPLSIRQLKAILPGADSDVSRVTDRLLKAGWVIKKPSKTDKRVSLVEITPEGNLVVEQVMSELYRLDELFFELSKSEVKTLNALLKKILN
jgi:MarR family 2-MHQ and catechol resistance regulon transcriptional repressor